MESNQEVTNPFDQIEVLDPNTKEFSSNDGRHFFVNMDLDTWSIFAYERWQKMSIELGFALSFSSLFDALNNAENLIMEQRYKEAFIEINNTKRGMARMTSDRHSIALYLCSLFILEHDEDPFAWTVEKANSKIDCWSKEFNAGFFLTSALSLVDGYKKRFLSTTKEFSSLSTLSQYLSEEEAEPKQENP